MQEKTLIQEKERYEELVSQYEKRARIHEKNRSHHRFEFTNPDQTILVQIGENAGSLHDISLGGISFYSSKEIPVGEKCLINFDNRYQVEVEIVNALLDYTDTDKGQPRIRHGAEFVREEDGFRCTIAVLEYFQVVQQAKI